MDNQPQFRTSRVKLAAAGTVIAVAAISIGVYIASNRDDSSPVPVQPAAQQDTMTPGTDPSSVADRIYRAVRNDDGYGSLKISWPRRETLLYWNGELPTEVHDLIRRLHNPPAVTITVHPAKYSDQQLQREQTRARNTDGMRVTQVSIKPDASGLDVYVDPASVDDPANIRIDSPVDLDIHPIATGGVGAAGGSSGGDRGAAGE